MKKFIFFLCTFSLSLFAVAETEKDKDDLFPVVVEFEDGTLREMYSDGNINAPDIQFPAKYKYLKFVNPETKEIEAFEIDALKSVYFHNENGTFKLSYLFLHYSAIKSDCRASKKLWKYKQSAFSVYEGKNINVYAQFYSSVTGLSKSTVVFFQRKGENAKFVMRAYKQYGIYTILPLKRALLNYFTEEDFVKRIKAGEFKLKHRKDWSLEYMVEIAKAYDESR